MKRLSVAALVLLSACTHATPPPSYWHLTVPVQAAGPGDAERLIRETVPLFGEVADAWARQPVRRSELPALLAKARKVERNLASALLGYLSLPPEQPNREAIERRTTRLQELLTAIRSCIKEVESSL
ncbi:MAG TPA: hypothetical protein VJB14_04965 [Planctomycetota bacterium]|nr:hypothetical protein [Planctomycetota bacterium]